MITGSLCIECEQRLSNLFIESNHWLLNHANKLTKNKEEAEDLVQELYEYLHLKCNPKIFYKTAYHMFYCYRFLESRWINKTKKLNKVSYHSEINEDKIDEEYDIDTDTKLAEAHLRVMEELKRLETTRLWAPAKIFTIYWNSDMTLDEVAKEIKISKSTVFLSVRKIRRYLKEVIDNPFNDV